MVRAAAKNHAHVGIVVDPSDYPTVLEQLRSNGSLDLATRRALARKAFAHTAAYDAAIVTWLDSEIGSDSDNEADEAGVLPPTIHISLERTPAVLRYGENPHQSAALYRPMGAKGSSSEGPWWDEAVLRSGIALSYLNIYDADAAMQLVYDIGSEPAVVIVKHANPCGVGISGDLATAYQLALECDERSAFGGVVARQPDGRRTDGCADGGWSAGGRDRRSGLRRWRRRDAGGASQEHPGHRVEAPGSRSASSPPGRRRVPGAGGASLRSRAGPVAGGHKGSAYVGTVARRRARLADLRTRQVERGRAGSKRPGSWYRSGATEPGRGRRDRS